MYNASAGLSLIIWVIVGLFFFFFTVWGFMLCIVGIIHPEVRASYAYILETFHGFTVSSDFGNLSFGNLSFGNLSLWCAGSSLWHGGFSLVSACGLICPAAHGILIP